jgi:hypothetical protein
MKVAGSVAEDLPQCFQLRRPRKWLAVQKCGSAEAEEGGRKSIPLHLPPP